jgi:hypothetical protein
MWGRVVEHTRGSRSRFAYPARLRLACGPCLAAGDGVVAPTVVAGIGEELTALCGRHGGDQRRDATPAAEVQTELLAAYGVEVMPIERLAHKVRPGPSLALAPVLRPLRAPALTIWTILRMLIGGLFMLWAFSGFIVIALAIVVGVFQAVTQALGLRPPTPTPPPSVVAADPVIVEASPVILPPEVDPPRAGSRPPAPLPVWSFAAICGNDAGQRLTIVPCGAPGDLIGFAERTMPEGAAHDCAEGWDAYTRGHRYWICWIDLRPGSPVDRRVHAPNPWSIPPQKGGALR